MAISLPPSVRPSAHDDRCPADIRHACGSNLRSKEHRTRTKTWQISDDISCDPAPLQDSETISFRVRVVSVHASRQRKD